MLNLQSHTWAGLESSLKLYGILTISLNSDSGISTKPILYHYFDKVQALTSSFWIIEDRGVVLAVEKGSRNVGGRRRENVHESCNHIHKDEVWWRFIEEAFKDAGVQAAQVRIDVPVAPLADIGFVFYSYPSHIVLHSLNVNLAPMPVTVHLILNVHFQSHLHNMIPNNSSSQFKQGHYGVASESYTSAVLNYGIYFLFFCSWYVADVAF